ncbi:MAG: glycosyl hydrolase [Streptosporangiales bacterium]|nr:glycosyl hydrolase [Streptosporangiales bacterium]
MRAAPADRDARTPVGSSAATTRFAPYLDITQGKPTLAEVARTTGQRSFTLAFVIATGNRCTPSWGGVFPLNDQRILQEVRSLRALGGDVAVSSGGADGPYLERVCGSAGSLAAAYGKALDAVGSNQLDVDIESDVPVERLNRAVAGLQRDGGTAVRYTVRVTDSEAGIEPVAVEALRSAADHGVDVTVNPMVMNFPFTADWGEAMVGAARATHRQMKSVWPDRSDAELYRMLGVTAMIGRNDSGMTTTLRNARTLLRFVRSRHLGYVGFWSVGRDNGDCPRTRRATDGCSGIAQSRYEFTRLFRA